MLKKTEPKNEEQNWGEFRITQRLLLWHPEMKKFLFVKEAPSSFPDAFINKHPECDPWVFVGGHVDKGENALDALKREISEEIGDKVEYDLIGPILSVHISSFSVIYLAEYRGGDIVLSDEHSEYAWFSLEDIEKNDKLYPQAKQVMLDAVKAAIERLKEREYLNDLKRLQADFENYRKRQEESKKELGAYLIEKLVMELIPVLDNFRSATQHVPEASKSDPWVVGIQYIEKQLEDALSANGMQTIEVKEGDAFDPRLHEAISQAEGQTETDGSEKGTIIAKVLQKGYKLGDRIIRPAKVVVS